MAKKAIRHYPVSYSVLSTMESLTEDTPNTDYRLFCHLLVDSFRRGKRLQKKTVPGFEGGGWIPMQKRDMDNWFYVGTGKVRERANPQRLQEQGLIEIYSKYVPGVMSIKYRIARNVIECLETATLSEPVSAPSYDLMTGKPWQDKWDIIFVPLSDYNYTEHNDDTPPAELIDDSPPSLVERSINAIRECHYNREALQLHLEKCRQDSLEALEEGNTGRADYLRGRFLNDLAIYRGLSPRSPFYPHYSPQHSGRIGTPIQNLTGESKAVAYSGIPNLYNYDLSSSQLRICCHYEFPRYGIECPWLDSYLADTSLREDYAAVIGITPDAFKEAIIGVLMGSKLPHNGTDTRASIFQALKDGLPSGAQSLEELDDMVSALKDLIAPLKTALNKWHVAILKNLAKEGEILNALKKSLTYVQVKAHSGSKRGAIAAHILQGTEAYFIHTLTTLANSYSFQVLGNEHDGLITLGQIPDAAIQEARTITGLHCLDLREKPFK
jgi:hypothetical protein